uniref:Uncharacterized protein n=1 Tax=Trichogramma kaykai TaxID=54128 RepID=A0ABD2WSG9_9HYME
MRMAATVVQVRGNSFRLRCDRTITSQFRATLACFAYTYVHTQTDVHIALVWLVLVCRLTCTESTISYGITLIIDYIQIALEPYCLSSSRSLSLSLSHLLLCLPLVKLHPAWIQPIHWCKICLRNAPSPPPASPPSRSRA